MGTQSRLKQSFPNTNRLRSGWSVSGLSKHFMVWRSRTEDKMVHINTLEKKLSSVVLVTNIKQWYTYFWKAAKNTRNHQYIIYKKMQSLSPVQHIQTDSSTQYLGCTDTSAPTVNRLLQKAWLKTNRTFRWDIMIIEIWLLGAVKKVRGLRKCFKQ